MVKIDIKTLSVNDDWQGRIFKTSDYKVYEELLLDILPDLIIPKKNIRLDYEFGFSTKSSDIDNPIKPLTDILQKKYKFNDNKIYEMNLVKKIVKKGNEYFKFNITELI